VNNYYYNCGYAKIIVAGLSEDELDSKGKLLASEEYVSKKIVDTELSVLAMDMRLRLQKELAQRLVNRASLTSCQSEAGSLNEHQGTNVANELFQSSSLAVHCSPFDSRSLKVTTGCSGSVKPSGIYAHGHSEEINEHQKCDITDVIGDSLVLSEASCFEMFWNPFDHLKLDSESAEKMAAMIDLSAEDFIPGDKCEEKLAADECAWKKENIPPAVGPTSAVVSNLDFSGIVGNAEISLHSVDVSHCGHQKKRVSVGEFFRLKSDLLGELGTKSNINTYFGMQTRSPEKGHKLLPLVEVEMDEDAAQEVSVNNQDYAEQTTRMFKSLSFSEGRKSSLYSLEHSSCPRNSLSLSCIADILANVDTCASPRTVVSNILKQSGLCNPKGIYPVKKAMTLQASYSSCLSDTSGAKDGVLKDTSNLANANMYPDSEKEDISNLSHSKYSSATSVGVVKEFDITRKGVLKVQKAMSDAVINLSDNSDRKGKLSGSNLMSSSYYGDGSTLSDTSSDGWVFSVPNTSVGNGAKPCSSNLKTCQKHEVAQALNEEDKNNDQTFTLEDSYFTGDIFKLTTLMESKQLNDSLLCVTQELARMPKESVDCSALVPALKKKFPELWPQLPEINMKDTQNCSKPVWHVAVQCAEFDHSVSRTLTESRTSAQSMMTASQIAVSGKHIFS
jgi:hypothetical protein